MTGRRQGFVRVPQRVLEGSALEVAVWAQLKRHERAPGAAVFTSRPTIMRNLGRSASGARAVSRATARLEQRGALTRAWRRIDGRVRRTYTLERLEDERYAALPLSVLDLVAAGALTLEQQRAWARWVFLIRQDGPRLSLADFARTWGGRERSCRDLRAALVRAGLLEVTAHPGRASETRPVRWARSLMYPGAKPAEQEHGMPEMTPAEARLLPLPDVAEDPLPTPAESGRVPRQNLAGHPALTPAESGRVPRRNVAGYPGRIWPTELENAYLERADLDLEQETADLEVKVKAAAMVTRVHVREPSGDEVAEALRAWPGCVAPPGIDLERDPRDTTPGHELRAVRP